MIRKTTPSEALTKLNLFIDRVNRLNKNEYSNKRFRTYDLSKIKFELKSITHWCSIGTFNKNKQRADDIINKASALYRQAQDFNN